MDIEKKNPVGNLRISNEVIATVAKTAAMEIDGVAAVSTGAVGVKGIMNRNNYARPVKITIEGGAAVIEIAIIVENHRTVTEIATAVQKNVKTAVENMISLQVNRVDIVVAGISDAAEHQ